MCLSFNNTCQIAQFTYFFKCIEGCIHVLLLIDATQVAIHFAHEFHAIVHTAFSPWFGTQYFRLIISKDNWCIHFTSLGFKHGACLGIRLTNHYRRTFFNNTSLLPSNLCQCVAQKLGVVETDVGDNADQRLNDVGAVQSSAQSHFYNGNIDFLFLEILESHCCSDFKERRMQRFKE